MTIAEKSAKSWVEHLFKIFIIDSGNAGPNFDPNNFDMIKNLIDSNLFANYKKGIVPQKSREKALKLAKKIWNKKLKILYNNEGEK